MTRPSWAVMSNLKTFFQVPVITFLIAIVIIGYLPKAIAGRCDSLCHSLHGSQSCEACKPLADGASCQVPVPDDILVINKKQQPLTECYSKGHCQTYGGLCKETVWCNTPYWDDRCCKEGRLLHGAFYPGAQC